MTFVLRIAGISCRLGRRRYFSPFRRVIRQIINNAASWRPDLPQHHLSPTTLTPERVFPKQLPIYNCSSRRLQRLQVGSSDSVTTASEPAENIRKRNLFERHVQCLQQCALGLRLESTQYRFYLGNALFDRIEVTTARVDMADFHECSKARPYAGR